MYSNLFVCLFGMSTVSVGLICIILLTMLMSIMVHFFERKVSSQIPEQKETEDMDKITAAIIAAIALEEHTDFSEIKILSLKKL